MKKLEQFTDENFEAANCRSMWLCVIEQALADSKRLGQDSKDLPRVVSCKWWREIFNLAGLSSRQYREITEQINKNLTMTRVKGLTKGCKEKG